MKRLKAFTIVELVVVLGIISVLAGLGIAGISYAQRTNRDEERKLIGAQFQSAIDSYLRANGGYPSSGSVSIQTNQISVAGKAVISLSGFKTYSSSGTTSTTTKYYYAKNTTGYQVCVYLEAGSVYQLGVSTSACPSS